MPRAKRRYSAGIYEQTDDGWAMVEWSRHERRDFAAAAARKYARARNANTGGSYTWSAWWRDGDGDAIEIRKADVS